MSIKLDGRIAEPTYFDLSRVGTRGSLQLLISPNGAELEVTVRSGDDPVPGAWVRLLAHPFRPQTASLTKGGLTDQYGRIKIIGIAPGKYKVFAVLEPLGRLIENPVEEKALDVAFREGERKQIEVPVQKLARAE